MINLQDKPYYFRLFLFFIIEVLISQILGNLITIKIGHFAPWALIVCKIIELLVILGLNAWLLHQRLYFHHLKRDTIIILVGIFAILIWIVFQNEMTYRIPAAITIGLLGALPEEVMVRGVALGSLLAHMSGKWLRTRAVILSSLVFALLHLGNLTMQSFPATITQAVNAFASGCLFAALYLRAGNLLAPIIAHFGLDFLATLGSSNANPFSIVSNYQRGEWVSDLIQFILQILIAILLMTIGSKQRRDRLSSQLADH